jgi:hypothetical protein
MPASIQIPRGRATIDEGRWIPDRTDPVDDATLAEIQSLSDLVGVPTHPSKDASRAEYIADIYGGVVISWVDPHADDAREAIY